MAVCQLPCGAGKSVIVLLYAHIWASRLEFLDEQVWVALPSKLLKMIASPDYDRLASSFYGKVKLMTHEELMTKRENLDKKHLIIDEADQLLTGT